MPRASDLSVYQVIIDGVKGVAPNANAFGCYPAVIMSNVPAAVEMRVGNTAKEVGLAPWVPYAAERLCFLRTGQGARTVFAQYRDASGVVVLDTLAAVPGFDASKGNSYDMPPSSAIQNGGGLSAAQLAAAGRSPLNGFVWKQEFSESHDFWSGYAYNAGQPNWGNVFYPATHYPEGHIATDDSMWFIDTPETPDSVLAMLTYPQWIMPEMATMNLGNTTVKFDLSSENLNLKGAGVYFWLIAPGASGNVGRWWKMNAPLAVGNDGIWSTNSLNIASTLDGWTKSWESGATSAPYFDKVISWGIGFSGFPAGDMPTGQLKMRDFSIRIT